MQAPQIITSHCTIYLHSKQKPEHNITMCGHSYLCRTKTNFLLLKCCLMKYFKLFKKIASAMVCCSYWVWWPWPDFKVTSVWTRYNWKLCFCIGFYQNSFNFIQTFYQLCYSRRQILSYSTFTDWCVISRKVSETFLDSTDKINLGTHSDFV